MLAGSFMKTKDSLFTTAKDILAHAHAPYSQRRIGSALKLTNGKIYSGVNIENASYGATVCAERVAIWKALSENPGELIEELLVCTDSKEAWPPCGLCRQVMAEFASPNLQVHVANLTGVQKTFAFKDLFPESFHRKFLEQK